MFSTQDKMAWPEHETLCLISIWGEDSIQAQIASSLDCSIAREKNSRAAWFRSMIVACAREYATLACVEVTPTYVFFWLALSEHRVNGGWPGSFNTGWLGSARHGSARLGTARHGSTPCSCKRGIIPHSHEHGSKLSRAQPVPEHRASPGSGRVSR